MKKLRKIVFWCHLPVGAIAGVVILTGAFLVLTGLALAIRRLRAWFGRRRAILTASSVILAPITSREPAAFDLQRNVNLDGR